MSGTANRVPAGRRGDPGRLDRGVAGRVWRALLGVWPRHFSSQRREPSRDGRRLAYAQISGDFRERGTRGRLHPRLTQPAHGCPGCNLSIGRHLADIPRAARRRSRAPGRRLVRTLRCRPRCYRHDPFSLPTRFRRRIPLRLSGSYVAPRQRIDALSGAESLRKPWATAGLRALVRAGLRDATGRAAPILWHVGWDRQVTNPGALRARTRRSWRTSRRRFGACRPRNRSSVARPRSASAGRRTAREP